MRDFELTFYRGGKLVSRAWYPAMKRGQACQFARSLLSLRKADHYMVEEV